ncbi:MAG TPA: DoxX family protein [Pseudonocardia sp.]|nr:DoxX family protein [Pseudonocardia sp.]
MTASTASTTTRSRGRIALWALQIFLGLFMIIASGAPKFFGEATAVEMFTEIGAGQWFRFLVGALEVAGGIGLLIPRLAGLAGACLAALMVGALVTQVFILDSAPVYAITPISLGVLFALIAYVRRDDIRTLVGADRVRG